ncbi:MAG: aldehyde dehydrogenase, partial [Xanthomonadales bacterium]|nr:aldehyde dehydrogenase [Xanthomonadales bacterium]
MRVPTINVSVVDLSFVAARPTTKDEIDQVLGDAASGDLKGVLAISAAPLVSVDF